MNWRNNSVQYSRKHSTFCVHLQLQSIAQSHFSAWQNPDISVQSLNYAPNLVLYLTIIRKANLAHWWISTLIVPQTVVLKQHYSQLWLCTLRLVHGLKMSINIRYRNLYSWLHIKLVWNAKPSKTNHTKWYCIKVQIFHWRKNLYSHT